MQTKKCIQLYLYTLTSHRCSTLTILKTPQIPQPLIQYPTVLLDKSEKSTCLNLCVTAVPSPLPPLTPTKGKKGKLPSRQEPKHEDVGAETTQMRERGQLETLNPLGRKAPPPSVNLGAT